MTNFAENMRNILVLILMAVVLQSCHVGRSIYYLNSNISDHKIFPKNDIKAAQDPFEFQDATTAPKLRIQTQAQGLIDLDAFLRTETSTTAFLIIRNDSILFENYYGEYAPSDISNIFSVSKSVTSLLVGIAIDDSCILSVHDPVTEYLPELLEADPMFAQLTISDALDMRTGLHFNEAYLNPFGHAARMYYGRNQMGLLKSLHFDEPPGGAYNYLSINTAILGMIVERSTNMSLADYLQKKVWTPMGMQNHASWSIDDKKHQNTKAYCCLNTTAIDLAKIARLYLNNGNWNGKTIVNPTWMAQTKHFDPNYNCYSYQWRAYKQTLPNGKCKCSQDYYAKGILGQFVYIHPDKDIIIIRLGEKADKDYLNLFQQLLQQL